MSKFRFVLLAIVFVPVLAFYSEAQEVTLTNFTLGRIEWDGPSLGYYQVEWASAPGGPWSGSWRGLGDRIVRYSAGRSNVLRHVLGW